MPGILTHEQKQLAFRLRARGWQLVDIAREIGCTAPMVGLMVREGRYTVGAPDEWEPRGSVASSGEPWMREPAWMRRRVQPCQHRSAFAGFRYPPEVIVLAVRWYLRFGLSYRDLEELLAERGVEVDHVTLFRWVQRFTPLIAEAARPRRHAAGGRWHVDETYVKVAGRWRYVYRAIDQHGQVIDVMVSARRDAPAARRFFGRALRGDAAPQEVTTDKAHALALAVEALFPSALHDTEQYANNRLRVLQTLVA